MGKLVNSLLVGLASVNTSLAVSQADINDLERELETNERIQVDTFEIE
jgi:hypothetical protein